MTIMAWRCWRTERKLNSDPLWEGGWSALPPNLMYSIFVPFAWSGPTTRAIVRDMSASFVWSLDYGGLHSLKKEFLHPIFLGNELESNFVIGQVEITGRAIEHEGGWRSEKQTIVELHVPEVRHVEPYRELFQCDVYVLDDIWDFFIPDERARELKYVDLPNYTLPYWAVRPGRILL